MSNPNFIINDSEEESDGAVVGEPEIARLQSASTTPSFLGPNYESSVYQVVPASYELRKKEIDEAHAALLSTGTLGPSTQADPLSAGSKAKRRQTAHGRLEGSGEQDVYAFNASDDDGFRPGSESKKRKRPSPDKKAARKRRDDDGDDGASDYGEGIKAGKKKTAKRSKSTGLPVLDLLNDSPGDDDWRPSAAKPPTSTRKSTRNNTGDAELLSPLPKPKRKPRESAITTAYCDPQQSVGNPTPNYNSADTHSAEIQVAGTGPVPPTPQNFVVDLTRNDLILPSERRVEYYPVSSGFPADGPSNFPGTNGVYNTPDLRSTIPDPPYDPSLLPSQIRIQELDSHVADTAPLATASIASDSPLSSPQNSPTRETPAAKKPLKVKKRAATDQLLEFTEDNGFGSFPLASEWRAAKGKARHGMSQATFAARSKTLNDLGVESGDDDVWAGDGKVAAKKRKKPAAKRRKPTANKDRIEEDREVQKPKSKRKEGKPIKTVVITDSEDELAGTAGITFLPEAAKKTITKLDPNTFNSPSISDNLVGKTVASNPLPDEDQLPTEEYKPPIPKKLHQWQQRSRNTIAGSDDEGGFSLSIPAPALAAAESEVLQQPVIKKKTAAQRRKSKKNESEEEDWVGDPEPAKKKESKPKTPRVTKKAAVAAVAKETREQKKALHSTEMVKDSGEEDENLALVFVAQAEPEPVLGRKVPAKKLSKAAAKKAKAQKEEEEEEEAEAGTEETADEEGEKKEATPTPETKPEPQPQTPSKNLMENAKKTPHSPINKGPVRFRVGLSRRAHIEPLLKVIRK